MHPIFWLGIAMLIASFIGSIDLTIKDKEEENKEDKNKTDWGSIIYTVLTIIVLVIGLFLTS